MIVKNWSNTMFYFKRFFLCAYLLLFYEFLCAQKPFEEAYDGIASVVQMDSFVIIAQKQGFDVAAFIDLVQKDRSFGQAFQNLRLFGYKANHEMQFFNKKGKKVANYSASTQQKVVDSCRSMQFLEGPEVQGDFFKKRQNYRYFTAKMYDKVFYTHQPIYQNLPKEDSNAKGLQKYYQELKTFIFEPGERVEVPIVANKTAIFSEELMPYYDYFISRETYLDQTDCWVFTIQVKEAFTSKKEGKTLVKYLKTYFDPLTLQVLGRKYEIVNRGLASCTVKISVELTQFNGHYLPKGISYDGSWNIPGKKRETGTFKALFYEFTNRLDSK